MIRLKLHHSMKKISSLFVMLTFSVMPCKNKVDKAFVALEMHDYFKAKDLFYGSLKKEPVAASFGLSKIFYQDRNYFQNLDSAKRYIDKAIVHHSILLEKGKEKLLRWSIDSISLYDHLDSLAGKVFWSQESIFSVNEINDFLINYPTYSQKGKVREIRDRRAFNDAKKDGSLFALQQFMETYPTAKQFQEAKEIYEYQKFTHNTAMGNEEELSNFIDRNPNSPYLRQAQKDLFMLYVQDDTKERYDEFIHKYPDNPNAQFALYNLLELSLYDFSLESLEAFLAIYSEMRMSSAVQGYLMHFQSEKDRNDPYFVGNYSNEPNSSNDQDWVEGMQQFTEKEKIGYRSVLDSVVIQSIFDDAFDFKGGLAVVEKDQNMGS